MLKDTFEKLPACGCGKCVMQMFLSVRSKEDPKFVYYLSAEFLMGRSLLNTVQNLELTGPYQ